VKKDKKKNSFFKIFVKWYAWYVKGMERAAKKNNFCKT
jgi:hypothetical protein